MGRKPACKPTGLEGEPEAWSRTIFLFLRRILESKGSGSDGEEENQNEKKNEEKVPGRDDIFQCYDLGLLSFLFTFGAFNLAQKIPYPMGKYNKNNDS